jgi:hypothetical protein
MGVEIMRKFGILDNSHALFVMIVMFLDMPYFWTILKWAQISFTRYLISLSVKPSHIYYSYRKPSQFKIKSVGGLLI